MPIHTHTQHTYMFVVGSGGRLFVASAAASGGSSAGTATMMHAHEFHTALCPSHCPTLHDHDITHTYQHCSRPPDITGAL